MQPGNRVACTRCLMPFDPSFIDPDGECVICHEHRKQWAHRDYVQKEQELLGILEHYKRRNRDKQYDVILAFSGGKDSVYALYLLKNKYGMRPLALTADNGLLTERALRNMATVVERLSVDHHIASRDPDELKALYRAYFRKTKKFCEICYLAITSALTEAAEKYDVPLLITGFAFKIDSSHFRWPPRYCFEQAFVKTIQDTLPEQVYGKYITGQVRAARPCHLLHLFDYVDHQEKQIYRILEHELGWDAAGGEDKHSDCRFHHMMAHLRWIANDHTSLALMTPAGLLRDGQITVEEFHALRAKDEATFSTVDRKQVEEFLEFFGVDEPFLSQELPPVTLAEPVLTEADFAPLVEAARTGGADVPVLLEMLVAILRPELARDGGALEIKGIGERRLSVTLTGKCRGCTIGDQVMLRYLEYLVRKYVSPEVLVEHVKDLIE